MPTRPAGGHVPVLRPDPGRVLLAVENRGASVARPAGRLWHLEPPERATPFDLALQPFTPLVAWRLADVSNRTPTSFAIQAVLPKVTVSALQTQQDILNAEFVWHGGYLSAPKVYDAGTSFSAPPALRHSEDDSAGDAGGPTGVRRIRFDISEEAWTVEFDAP